MEKRTSVFVVPGVDMGKRWNGKVQESLRRRVQTEHILGTF